MSIQARNDQLPILYISSNAHMQLPMSHPLIAWIISYSFQILTFKYSKRLVFTSPLFDAPIQVSPSEVD